MATKEAPAPTTPKRLNAAQDAATRCVELVANFPRVVDDLRTEAMIERVVKGGRRTRAAFDAGRLVDTLADVGEAWEAAVEKYRPVGDFIRHTCNTSNHRRFDPPQGFVTFHAAAIQSWNTVWAIVVSLSESPAWHGPTVQRPNREPTPYNFDRAWAFRVAIEQACVDSAAEHPVVLNLGAAIRSQRHLFDIPMMLSLCDATRAAAREGTFPDAAAISVGVDLEFDLAYTAALQSELEPPVTLRGQEREPLVLGSPVSVLPPAKYAVIELLTNRYPHGATKSEFKSGDAAKSLREIRESDARWATVIFMPGKHGKGGYRLRYPDE